MAGSSNYPTSVDNPTALADGVDYIQADDVNNAYVPVTAVQTMLGASGAIMSKNTDILTFLANAEKPQLTYASDTSLSLSAGTVLVKNASQSVKVLRRSTSAKTLTSSNLDTGSFVVGYYYVYACADAAGNDFTAVISASASSPTGYTNYELVSWFYNEANGSLNVATKYIGNMKTRRDVPNAVTMNGSSDQSTSSTSFTDLMTMYFYSSGRPCLFIFEGVTAGSANNVGASCIFDVDASNVSNSVGREISANVQATDSAVNRGNVSIAWMQTLSAGTHTIKVQYRTSTGTTHIYERRFIVLEL